MPARSDSEYEGSYHFFYHLRGVLFIKEGKMEFKKKQNTTTI